LLGILEEYKVQATFFVLGKQVEENRGQARRIYEAGHELANHSWTHDNLSDSDEETIRSELGRTSEIIREVTGEYPALFRAPYFGENEPLRAVCAEMGMEIIGANVIGHDWEDIPPKKIAENILQNAVDGGIILLHEQHSAENLRTINALPAIFSGLGERGFEFVSIKGAC
jgi:peptidoglycan/xylan/chitin deacetylase (PgdA/CDA1 family)